ncbi:MAG: hypothetical protein JO190_00265 [Candidatus Eremiobacteraeota bacterium]|nr:hypothetical protein [Candidatus Eremiobacteraeota bacterium]MBV8498403.1 hypothetical protein [Candidatus Eremiobacteraeota bacterium]
MSGHFAWTALFLLGCYHGLNPAMGWLFAVALGMQERRIGAVLLAIVPLAVGHIASVAAIVALAVTAAVDLPRPVVHGVAAGVLLGFGAYRLIRIRHPRWVGMRVGFWGLCLWGFLMSSAHGAGLMLVPFVTAGASTAPYAAGAAMLAVHTLGYLATMTAVALVVYAKVGVSFLRTAWLNVDVIWAIALIVTGIVALFV